MAAGASVLARGATSRSLFDGQSLDGWRAVGGGKFPAHCWNVTDGCLHACVAKPTYQDIRTIDEYGDFELEFEWKIARDGNSGVKYLIYHEDVWSPPGVTTKHARGRGFEYQVADGAAARGELETAGALYGFLAPSQAMAKPCGEFNEARIIRQGMHVEHWLNGQRVLSVQLDAPETLARMRERKVPAEFPRRSPIVLQNHASEAWFRKLRIML